MVCSDRYSNLSISLHWLTVILVVLAYASIEARTLFDHGSAMREFCKSVHFHCGVILLVVVLFRLIIKPFILAPSIKPIPPEWQRFVAKLLHAILYLFLLTMIILGLMILSFKGKHLPFALPNFTEFSPDMSVRVKYWHVTLSMLGYYFIGLHAFAALWHHYQVKDNTLKRMWFKR